MLDWQEKDVRVRMETKFPAEDIITLTVNTKKSQELDLKIRVPYWATQGAEVTINGKKQNVESSSRELPDLVAAVEGRRQDRGPLADESSSAPGAGQKGFGHRHVWSGRAGG